MQTFMMRILMKYLILEIRLTKDDERKVRGYRRKRNENDARKGQIVKIYFEVRVGL